MNDIVLHAKAPDDATGDSIAYSDVVTYQRQQGRVFLRNALALDREIRVWRRRLPT